MTVWQGARGALKLLSRRDRRLLGIAVGIQMSTSLLDLVGVLLIGLVAALSVTTVQSQPPPTQVTALADTVGLGSLTPQQLVAVFASAAAVILLSKSVISSYLLRRVFVFLANRQALVAARLTRELLGQPLLFVQKRSSQETAYALIGGVVAATSVTLAQLVVVVSELSLLVVLGAALLFLNPAIAIGSIVFFGLLAIVLQLALGRRAGRTGREGALAEIQSLNAVQEAVAAYREATVSDRRSMYVDRIQTLRWEAARINAESQWLGMFPRYIFEAALVLGGFAIAGFLFATEDSVAAIGSLAVFLAAGTRVMPSLLRMQGAMLTLRASAGASEPTYELASELGQPIEVPSPPMPSPEIRDRIRRGSPGFVPSIELSGVTLSYPGSRQAALRDVSLRASPGESIALVGRSGAGKSTLADVILGVLKPDGGEAFLGGLPPDDAIKRWPGGVAYVPQDVQLSNDTVRSNVALGLPRDAIDDDLVWEALRRAHAADLVREKPAGLDTLVGENGVLFSGGQKQRLGIARALYTRPRLLVLDEATSALDAETEYAITEMLHELDGEVTLVVVAHRLSTVRQVDRLYYLEDGRIRAQGTFEEILQSVPAFARQAHLIGIGEEGS